MIYITQLIYIASGQAAVFEEFESMAIPLIAEHGGELLLRMRPAEDAMIEGTLEMPYEVHVVTFPDDTAFASFMKDERRQQFLHLKVAALRASVLVKGEKL